MEERKEKCAIGLHLSIGQAHKGDREGLGHGRRGCSSVQQDKGSSTIKRARQRTRRGRGGRGGWEEGPDPKNYLNCQSSLVRHCPLEALHSRHIGAQIWSRCGHSPL